MDYWLIKLDNQGNPQWQQSYGGQYYDLLQKVIPTQDGYLLAGYSNSDATGDKTNPNKGESDFWILKTDTQGHILWQQTIGKTQDDQLFDAIPTQQGYLLGGNTRQAQETDMWIVAIDTEGKILWQQTYDNGGTDLLISLQQNKNTQGEEEYLISGYLQDTQKNDADYVAIKINNQGKKIWSKTIGGDKSDRLQHTIQTRDNGYLLAGTSDSSQGKDREQTSQGQNDFYLVKLLDTDQPKPEKSALEVYPNPTERFTNVLITDIETLPKNNTTLQISDLNGSLLQKIKITQGTTTVDLASYPPGVYLFTITLPTGNPTVKVIKKGNL